MCIVGEVCFMPRIIFGRVLTMGMECEAAWARGDIAYDDGLELEPDYLLGINQVLRGGFY